jgi:hypothetical protein
MDRQLTTYFVDGITSIPMIDRYRLFVEEAGIRYAETVSVAADGDDAGDADFQRVVDALEKMKRVGTAT